MNKKNVKLSLINAATRKDKKKNWKKKGGKILCVDEI